MNNIRLYDKNETLQAPGGFQLHHVSAQGSYLRLVYSLFIRHPETFVSVSEAIVVIYLNDEGREVIRTVDETFYPVELAPNPDPLPVSRWYRFCNGWLLALQGLQEMSKCLSR